MSSKFILYSYSIFFFIPSILLSYKTERYWEPSRRIRENGKKRGWIVKKKNTERRRWRIRKPGLAFFVATNEQVERGKRGNDLTRRGGEGRKERVATCSQYFSILSSSIFLSLSLSEGPCPPHPFNRTCTERERKREIPTVEEYPRVAGQEWQREWQSGWSYTLDPEGMQRSTVERESNERVVLPRLV